MKYGIWNVAEPSAESVNRLVRGGYAPLVSMILAARGIADADRADALLNCSSPLLDPFLMTDMALAAGRLREAVSCGEKIAVFGDYDVDGITATCLLTEVIRRAGGDCRPYIPGRLEEGYGLNPIAIKQLSQEGVRLIVTVDCGITAVDEAELCSQLGIDLVITDHHECKEILPRAVAVVDPHRVDGGYPHKNLSGVGVAFKLASALWGKQEEILEDYADLVCLGTVADVMPLQGENRVFVTKGLEALRKTRRLGLAELMRLSGCEPATVNAASVGYILAPRINAAGRMGQIDLAVELFLTKEPARAEFTANALCELNRQRQAVESEIYQQAVGMLPPGKTPEAIVLADETWHQGVVGIVASRISEEYCCPTFLVCLDGEHGKASSRSYGGFNLFAALSDLSDLLESYGGHEQAAGFTIQRNQIPEFRKAICELAARYYTEGTPRTTLEADCTIPFELLTIHNVESLERLEPCGNGCPKPVLVVENLQIERIMQVGNGRHMRLRLRNGRFSVNAIYFSTTPEAASVGQGDWVDVAFVPQINDFRGERSVQMNVVDIRPSCHAECSEDISGYRQLRAGTINAREAEALLPDRNVLATVWRYLAEIPGKVIRETPMCLCRKIVRRSGMPMSLGMLLTCLDIFADVQLLKVQYMHKDITITLADVEKKADLSQSCTMQRLLAAKES